MKKLYVLKTALFLLLMVITSQAIAQSKTFNDIRALRLKNFGTITDNNEVTGYYFFYVKDKVDRKTRTFSLQILDQNLNVIGKKDFDESKRLNLVEGAYNGKNIMMKFYDSKTRELSYRFFDKSAKLIEQKSVGLLNKDEGVKLSQTLVSGEGTDNMFAIPDRGFVDYSSAKGKSWGYKIDYIPTDGSKDWNVTSDLSQKGVRNAMFMNANDDMLVTMVAERPKLMTVKGTNYNVIATDLSTGKAKWEYELRDKQFMLSLINSYIDDNGDVVLFGNYFLDEKSRDKGKSLGLFTTVLSSDGKVKKQVLNSWAKEVGKFMKVNDKGKIQDVGYIYFHDIIKTADGKIIGVGEQYKKSLSAMGALSALNQNSEVAAFKIVVRDFFFFQFNSEFELEDLKIIEKGKSNVLLPKGMGLVSTPVLANYVKAVGGFDYSYSQEENDGDVFHIGYMDWDRTDGLLGKTYFGGITYTDGEFTNDKIDINRKAKYVTFRPAKTGHVMITEYFRKDKKLVLRLEPFNY